MYERSASQTELGGYDLLWLSGNLCTQEIQEPVLSQHMNTGLMSYSFTFLTALVQFESDTFNCLFY